MKKAILLSLLTIGACSRSADEFLQERAELLCKANECCADEDVYYTAHRYPDQCVSHELEDVLAECPLECEYNEDAATKCILAIRGIKYECDLSDYRFPECKNVFVCEDEGMQEACNAKPVEEEITSNCSVSDRSSPFVLFLLLFGIRRRK